MTGPQVTDPNPNPNPNPPNQEPPNPNPSDSSEIPTPNTPPVVTDVIPREEFNRTMEGTHSLYRQALVEAETKRKELERQLEAANVRQQPAPIPESELSPAQLIERAVASQVAPLREQFSGFMQTQQQNTYQQIKNSFRTLPQFTGFFTQIEAYLDQEMQGKAITVENVQNSLATVIGRIQMQAALQPQNNNPQNQQQPINPQQPQMPNNPQQQQRPQNPNMPAHLRPSAPPLPNRNGAGTLTPAGNERYQLTELQKRVARENRLTDDQYIDWITESPSNVVHSTIGVPPRTT